MRSLKMKKSCPRSRSQAGFTLVELLIVLTILGLLMAIATPALLRQLASAKIKTTQIEMKNIEGALDIYLIDVGRYPTQQEGIEALVTAPEIVVAKWAGPYISKREGLVDPWGHPYQYKMPGDHGEYDLYSLGPNGSGADETTYVKNW